MSDNKDTVDNLSIWRSVEETDISYTKESTHGGRSQTSINGTYMVKRATETFGPIGKGWGYEIVEERNDNGRPIYVDGEIYGHEMINTIRLKLWYMSEGQRCEVEHYGHTPFVTWSQKYKSFNTDLDASKKSLTDAIKKCLSMLGFSADIFLGQFENYEYLQEVTEKSVARKENERDEQIAKDRKEYSDWFEDQIKSLDEITKPGALQMRYEDIAKRAERDAKIAKIDYTPWRRSLTKAYNKRLEVIAPEIDLVCQSCGVEQKGKKNSSCKECGGATTPTK